MLPVFSFAWGIKKNHKKVDFDYSEYLGADYK